MTRARSAQRRIFAEAAFGPAAAARRCDHPECSAEGRFPAPKSREPRDGRWHFCLDHVRQYNAGWDFFRGMTDDDILRYQREDVLGHRPTWRLGTKPQREEPQVWVKDDLGLLAEVGITLGAARRKSHAELRLHPREREALTILGFDLGTLSLPLRKAELKAQYKVMVKRYHPDANGGDKAAEERLKTVNQAYAYLQTRGYT
ncbi:DnaJ domain-containing protein [Ferrovibrio sp.]|uniref:DnaJ domain-containing protein n=1 Tax=Ferrovibrio sp. TaxID=1917215 RepID=UPI00311EF515